MFILVQIYVSDLISAKRADLIASFAYLNTTFQEICKTKSNCLDANNNQLGCDLI